MIALHLSDSIELHCAIRNNLGSQGVQFSASHQPISGRVVDSQPYAAANGERPADSDIVGDEHAEADASAVRSSRSRNSTGNRECCMLQCVLSFFLLICCCDALQSRMSPRSDYRR